MRHFSGKFATVLIFLLVFGGAPSPAQPNEAERENSKVMQGYLFEKGNTPESYLISSPDELKAFVATLPPHTPFKVLPAPPNPDPLLKGFKIDFQQSVMVVAVGRNRIARHPRYQGVDELANGDRRVRFVLPAATAGAYPFGWAVYSAIVLPRSQGKTTVVVQSLPAK